MGHKFNENFSHLKTDKICWFNLEKVKDLPVA